MGYDIADDAIAAAREEAEQYGVANVSFEVMDVAALPSEPKFDVITAFDAIHDQRAPDAVLRGAHRALAPYGIFVMIEFKFSSRLEDNIKNPYAPMYYGFSLMHCMPVSLALDGQGLGTVWGEHLARQYLAEAGFGNVTVLDSPRPQNSIFVARH
jgi:ubiquinone/menaquinone biosynthesis C-methylase UbiE